MPRTLDELDVETTTLISTQEQILDRVNQLETEADTRLDELELWRKEKPGWKTTEFWGSHLFAILTMMIQMDLFGPTTTQYKVIALVAGALSILGYGVSRGLKKSQDVTVVTSDANGRRIRN